MPIAPNCLTLLLIKCKISGSLWGLLLLRGSRQGFLRRMWGGISQCPVVSYMSHWDKEFTDSWESVFYGCMYRCFWKKPIFECEDLAGPKLLRSEENTMEEEWVYFPVCRPSFWNLGPSEWHRDTHHLLSPLRLACVSTTSFLDL